MGRLSHTARPCRQVSLGRGCCRCACRGVKPFSAGGSYSCSSQQAKAGPARWTWPTDSKRRRCQNAAPPYRPFSRPTSPLLAGSATVRKTAANPGNAKPPARGRKRWSSSCRWQWPADTSNCARPADERRTPSARLPGNGTSSPAHPVPSQHVAWGGKVDCAWPQCRPDQAHLLQDARDGRTRCPNSIDRTATLRHDFQPR